MTTVQLGEGSGLLRTPAWSSRPCRSTVGQRPTGVGVVPTTGSCGDTATTGVLRGPLFARSQKDPATVAVSTRLRGTGPSLCCEGQADPRNRGPIPAFASVRLTV